MSEASAARAGRAIGAMFFAVFGGAWIALWAYTEFSPPWLPLALVGLATAALFGYALKVFRLHKAALAAQAGTPQERRRSRGFNIVNAAQWVLIFVVANILQRTGHGEYVVPAVILVVGLHFLPLAALFSYRPHYVTGAVLTLWPLLYASLASPASSIGPLGAGIVLWCSAAWGLRAGAAAGEPPG